MELAIPRAGAVREASLAVGFLGAIGIIAANAVLHAGVVLAFIAGPLLVLFVLARPELGVWLVILLTPLEVIGPLSFSMSKAAKLALTLLVATALLLTRRKDGTNQPDSYVWPFALIVISGFFSSLLAASPLTSLLGLASIAIFVLSYTAVRRSAVLTGKGTLLLRVLIWSAVLLTPLCFLQLTTGYSGVTSAAAEAEDAFGTVWPGISRASAAFNGPNAAGAFFAVAAIAALTHAIVHRQRRLWYLLAAFLFVADVLTTFSRGALLGCILGLAFACWAMRLLSRRRLVALALCSAVALASLAATENVRKYLRIGADLVSVSPERVGAWQAAKVILKRNPVFGIGLYQFQTASRGIAGVADMPLHPHNGFLKALVEQGPAGGFAYLLFLWAFVRRSRETLRTVVSTSQKWVLGAIAGAGICLFTQELFDANFTLGGSSMAILFSCLLAIQTTTNSAGAEPEAA